MKGQETIKKIKGIGPKKCEELAKLGIKSMKDFVYFFPRAYEDRTKIVSLSHCKDGEYAGVLVKVLDEGKIERINGRKLVLIKVPIEDKGVIGEALWYNMPFMKNTLKKGALYYLYGKMKIRFGKIQIERPDYQIVKELPFSSQGILPIYSLTSKLNQKEMRRYMQWILAYLKGQWKEYLPTTIRQKYKLCEINFALENIHFPKSFLEYEIAKKRLIFDEFFLLQMGLYLIKNQNERKSKGITFTISNEVEQFISNLPFELTGAQEKVIREIMMDLSSGKAMNRLVQGDVGSGKTIVGAIALFIACLNGYQGVMMAPTEILARQHYKTMKNLFKNFNIKIGLLIGSLKSKEKREIIEDISQGKIHIVVGTHAIIQESISFHKVGLVITDEQHRFGVKQRACLREKGRDPHVMVMTATPIPRTLAFILYGDLDISIINELPPGRKKVETYHVSKELEARVYKFIKKNIKLGRQAYIVCPLVDESENIEASSAVQLIKTLSKDIFKEEKIALLHGKMHHSEKEAIMNKFKNKEIDILVATTVIEVGIDVPNATIMVIQNAERFGLAQLHQLRGRVGRGDHKSYCILISQGGSNITKERLKTLTETNDGFVIAEKDLLLRGPGEFFGIRQHGLPELRIANLLEDREILKMAEDACKEVLTREEYKSIQEDIFRLFQERINDIILN